MEGDGYAEGKKDTWGGVEGKSSVDWDCDDVIRMGRSEDNRDMVTLGHGIPSIELLSSSCPSKFPKEVVAWVGISKGLRGTPTKCLVPMTGKGVSACGMRSWR